MEPQTITGGSSTWELEILVDYSWRFHFSGIWTSVLLLRQFGRSTCNLYVVSNSVTRRHIPQLQLSSTSQILWTLNVLWQDRQKITTHCSLQDLYLRVLMLRIKSRSEAFVNGLQHHTFLRRVVVSTSLNPPLWSTIPCLLSATAYSICSQVPTIFEAVPPSATWGRAMPWWQRPTYHDHNVEDSG
jgi:hypothetical protein